jgi:branched-chain amino acid transport system substrate-binding protein
MGGKQVLNGIRLAVDEYNSKNEKKIVINVEDSKAEPAVAVSAVNKLIQIEGIDLFLGDLTSSVTLAIAPILEKNHKILLAPGASNPKVRFAGDFIFRNWVSDDYDGMVVATYAFKNLSLKRASILYIQNDYGIGLMNSFEKKYGALGGEVIYKEAFSQGESDFRSILAKLKGYSFDLLYIAGQPKEMGYLVKQAKEMGVSTAFFGNASVEEKDFQTIVSNIGVEIYYTSPTFDLSSNREIVRKFVDRFSNKFSTQPDVASAHGYDAARLLIHCIDQGITNSDNVKKCLYAIKGFEGVTGVITIDEYGDPIKGLFVKKLEKDGAVKILDDFIPSESN